jgi:catechol 2,3-dioxygenase-like lactoylglutathione lyase family enzyme
LIVERTDFISVPVTDMERAVAFYRDTLGLEQVSAQGFSEFTAPHIALRVPDVAATRDELEARGVAFDGDILDTGVCHMAAFKDPDGNNLMLHRRYAPRG